MSPSPSRRHPDTPRLGATPSASSSERAFAAAWLAHVEAGRIGGHLNRPTASLLEAGRLAVNEEARATLFAHQRLMRGDGRLAVW